MVSKRPTMKQAKEQANGTLPVRARPAATPTMLDSAMPRLNARPGYFLAKAAVMVDFERSASSVTMRSSRAPRSRSASPNAARLAFAGMSSPLLLVERAQLAHQGGRRAVCLEVRIPRRLGDAEDFPDGRDGFRRLWRLAVPLGTVLHEGDALALDRVGDDEGGPALRGFRLVERLADLIQRVAVDLDDGPPEALPLGHHRLEVEDLRDEIVELDLVVVEDDGEVVERMARLPELRRRHRGLPHLPLLDLAVSENAVDAGGRATELETERHAERHREPFAERPGGGLDAGQRHAVGMTLQRRAQLAKRDQPLLREIAGLGHDGVERRHCVAFREDDAVAVGPVGARGIVA